MHRRNPIPATLLLLLVLTAAANVSAQPRPADPLMARESLSAQDRRAHKKVVGSRLLDDMETGTNWTHFGPGGMALSAEHPRSGRTSLRLTAPTKLDRPGPVPGRPFGEAGVRRRVAEEDWSAFNRIAVDIYPRLPRFRTISILLKLHAAGSDRWPYTFGHLHHVLLKGDQWNHVEWEIPHLPRTQVTGVDFIYRLQGNEPGAAESVLFDFEDLRLERVEDPDPFHGWEVAPGSFAFHHLGYAKGSRKIAVAAAGIGRFEVGVPGLSKPAFEGLAVALTNSLGAFSLLDFSALEIPGFYAIRAGSQASPLFPITEDPRQLWLPALAGTLNHYRCQRCGEAVPGIHAVCHADWRVTHGDRSLPLNGGWHDAGDLSQGLVNTSEAVEALLGAAELPVPTWRTLAERLQLEAGWGLRWMHRTRFGDGHRATWATMDYWTDGVMGTVDDTVAKAGNGAFDNLIAAAASARAGRLLTRHDPRLAGEAPRVAAEDWRFAMVGMDSRRTEWLAAAIHAATELYRTTSAEGYRDRAVEFANALMGCQQVEVPAGWSIPLSGFFYAGTDRQRVLNYEHRGHNQAPAVALAGLCDTFPTHADEPRWREAVRRHAEYLAATAELSAPWYLPAAGIYRLADGDAEYQRQVRQGVRLDDKFYLRRFPVWRELRGNSGVLLSQAWALAAAGGLLKEPRFEQLARTQLEWHLGRNPFAQSLMYGVGYDFAPQYSSMSGQIVGGLPVGIQTRMEEDVPYWPASSCYNYAEIWVHASSRYLATLTELLSSLK